MEKRQADAGLADRYVYAVTRRLPADQRDDVGRELHDLIGEMVFSRGGEDDAVGKVLTELGDPAELADNYRGHKRYVIGPAYFDLYVLMLKIVLFAVSLGIMIALAVGYAFSPPESVFSALAQAAKAIFSAAVQAFAWVTVAFAVIEWNRRRLGKTGRPEPWSLDELPEVPDATVEIPKGEPIASLVFLVIWFAVLNASPWLARVSGIGETVFFVNPFIPEVFKRVLVLINITIVLDMCVEFAKLFIGVQSVRLSVVTIPVKVADLVISLYIVGVAGIWNPGFVDGLAGRFGWMPDTVSRLQGLWTHLPVILMAVLAVGFAVETVQTIRRTWNPAIPKTF